MGTMMCYRKDCDNILCETYVESVGYICSSCQAEFKEYLVDEGLNPTTERQIRIELKNFMATPKLNNAIRASRKEMTIDEFFNGRTTTHY